MNDKLPYPYEMTAFASCVPDNKFDNLLYRPAAAINQYHAGVNYQLGSKATARIFPFTTAPPAVVFHTKDESYCVPPEPVESSYFAECEPLSLQKIDEVINIWNDHLPKNSTIYFDPKLPPELKTSIFNNKKHEIPPSHPDREYYCYRLVRHDKWLLTCYKDLTTGKIVKYIDPPKP